MMPILIGRARGGTARLLLILAALSVACISIAPANAAIVDQPEGGLTKSVCHDEATVLLVAAQFGSVFVVKGPKAAAIVAAAWGAIDERPPVVSKLFMVVGKDDLVRVFAANQGCVRGSIAAPFGSFRAIFGDAMEQIEEARQ